MAGSTVWLNYLIGINSCKLHKLIEKVVSHHLFRLLGVIILLEIIIILVIHTLSDPGVPLWLKPAVWEPCQRKIKPITDQFVCA